MIAKIFLVCIFAGVSTGQYHANPKDAAILSEARYLSGNGQFGAAYKQEDGVEFKEESDGAGNRKGSYSYVDPTGQRRTVTYTAGKDGFRPTGDHLPPIPVVPVGPAVPEPSQSNYKTKDDEDDGSYREEPSYNQGQNNFDYVPQQKPYSAPLPQYSAPRPLPPRPQYNPQPQYNPPSQYNPQSQFNSQSQYNPLPQYNPPTQFQFQSPSYNSIPAANDQPRRAYQPGKINLDRSPDGFSYSFSKA